jgi:stress response protein YsnF
MIDQPSRHLQNLVEEPDKVRIAEEQLRVEKVAKTVGTVRVSTETDVVQEIARADLSQDRVEISEVEIGSVVTTAPQIRIEGDTTIVPVLEERLVVERQLVLVREIHITRRTSTESVSVPVSLRKQRAVVERTGSDEDPSGG